MKIFLIYLVTVQFVYSTLIITDPDTLAIQYLYNGTLGQLPFDQGNFGHYPYGSSLKSRVTLPIIRNACEFNKSVHLSANLVNSFILADDLGCTYVTKARNIQQMGGVMAIIISEQLKIKDDYIMINDGTGFDIRIPTIMISKPDGQILKKYIEDLELNKQVDIKQYPEMKITFETNKTQNPEVYLALSLEDRQSLKLVKLMKDFFLQTGTLKDVYYHQYECIECKNLNYSIPQINCLGGGRYCELDPPGWGNGQDLMYETLRQVCIFQQNQQKWFDYIEKFDLNCLNPLDYQACSDNILKNQINLNQLDLRDIYVCIEYSFDRISGVKRELQINTVLEKQKNFKRFSGLIAYPGIVINQNPYLGTIRKKYIIEEICQSYITKPEICEQTKEIQQQQEQHKNTFLKITGYLFLTCFIFFVLLMLVHKLYLKKEYSKQTKRQVNEIVNQYIQFYEAKTKREEDHAI